DHFFRDFFDGGGHFGGFRDHFFSSFFDSGSRFFNDANFGGFSGGFGFFACFFCFRFGLIQRVGGAFGTKPFGVDFRQRAIGFHAFQRGVEGRDQFGTFREGKAQFLRDQNVTRGTEAITVSADIALSGGVVDQDGI